MIRKIVRTFDKKSGNFGNLIAINTAAEAERVFQVLCKNDPMMRDYPEDFQMILVGEDELETGKISRVMHIVLVDGQDHANIDNLTPDNIEQISEELLEHAEQQTAKSAG